VKIGRTHTQDATPLTLGQEFSGYATQVFILEPFGFIPPLIVLLVHRLCLKLLKSYSYKLS
jgi:hypothetical protein